LLCFGGLAPIPRTIESYLNKITLAEKVGQMTQVGINDFVLIGNKEDKIKREELD
jgi:hypothetical protein